MAHFNRREIEQMDRDALRKVVQKYLYNNHLKIPELVKLTGISDRTIRRFLNTKEGISKTILQKLNYVCAQVRFAVVGFRSGKVYFQGKDHADCSRWINDQSSHKNTSHEHGKVVLNIKEPLIIKKVPTES